MAKRLTNEIALRILEDIGLSDLNMDNWAGLGSDSLCTGRAIKIKYPDHEYAHPIWAGKLTLEKFSMKGILINLSITGNEVLFVFRSGDKPIHAISCVDDGDIAFIKIFNEKNNTWKDATVQMQAMMLSGFESICSLGLLWDACDDFDDLYAAASNVISTF